MRTLLKLSTLLIPLWPVMALAVILGTFGFFCAIGIPLYGILALEQSLPLWVLLLFGLLRGGLRYGEQYCNHYIAFTLLARIRHIVFKKLRSLGPAKLDGRDKGSLISLITSDIELLEVFYAHTVSPTWIALLVSGTMCGFFAFLAPQLAVVAALFYILVGIVVPALVGPAASRCGTEHRHQAAAMNSLLLDSLRGLTQTIRYGGGQRQLEKIQGQGEKLSKSHRGLTFIEGYGSALSGFFVTSGTVTMLFVSLLLAKQGLLTINQGVVATVAIFSSFGPVLAIANLGSGLSQTVASGKRVLSLLAEEPVVEDVSQGVKVDFTGARVCELGFTYPKVAAQGDEPTLDGITMDFPSGSVIGIQGKSGSGKSTLLKLLMRFWQADRGQVLISNEPIESIPTAHLRQLESLVTQETVLFHDTIENNIRIAKLDATPEEVQEACKKAALHDFIVSLPRGYQTQVAELGDNFSGGERQRLGLARAFLHQSDLMLLDEPTSNLDAYNERLVMDAVKAHGKGKTVVIVSHRDSTFVHADQVYKLNAGRR